ncbi:MAG: hypothetical protein HY097_06575 [Nitrospinae bacterium]|nr:hypothetical protein [Nitrospinota bacterium]
MKVKSSILILAVLFAVSFSSPAWAAEAPAAAPAQPAAPAGPEWKIPGMFKNWALSQNNFRMGRDGGIQDEYVVSIVEFMPELVAFGGDVKVKLNIDVAQGWWGVDNSQGTFIDYQGSLRTHGGPGGIYENKGTTYDIHVDEAYIDFKLPFMQNTRADVGRKYIGLGNKLVLDYEYSGIGFTSNFGDITTYLTWRKVSEGYAGLGDKAATSYQWDSLIQATPSRMSGQDADLYLINVDKKLSNGKVSGFYAYYNDKGTDDGIAYLYDMVDYSNARFRPQIGTLNILGVSGDMKFGKIALKFEGDYLSGTDPIDNKTYNSSGIPQRGGDGRYIGGGRQSAGTAGSIATAGTTVSTPTGTTTLSPVTAAIPGYLPPHYFNRLDKNDGNISGWNLYADLSVADVAPGITPGFKLGMGSGDSDLRKGAGNINKLQTEGWFYITEVWEDSIMPDLTGITPQGLGAPWPRGYREFENQILLQANVTWKPAERWKIFGSYTYVTAQQDIPAWTSEPTTTEKDTAGSSTRATTGAFAEAISNTTRVDTDSHNFTSSDYANSTDTTTYPATTGGPDYTRTSKDIGQEIDLMITYNLYKGMDFDLRGGYFLAGDGARYLIAGAKGWDQNPWEARWDITWRW